ncbi:hypothetical protein B0A50_06133 [Salinomyces thailandicus]|uniref:Opioid growth factor receptor (OGFr) conserved domain-containing protein n=1 Tax=Salinomyces thailandicus TaxID=706561 RepID=A0A4V6WJQ0_9PEZI|nr:hypothetical protein B0A50_06133 [Salinomyces thailandica]
MSRTISLYSPSMKAALDSSDPDDTLESIITTWTNDMLEARHDYIQHLFPLPERSPINPNAPLITKDVRDAFLKHKDLSTQLGRAFARMAAFYGFVVWDNGNIAEASNFQTRARDSWLTTMDHNHLRISRIIRCMRILGLQSQARRFLIALLSADQDQICNKNSVTYWCRAALWPLETPPSHPQDPEVSWLKGDEKGSNEEVGDERGVGERRIDERAEDKLRAYISRRKLSV